MHNARERRFLVSFCVTEREKTEQTSEAKCSLVAIQARHEIDGGKMCYNDPS